MSFEANQQDSDEVATVKGAILQEIAGFLGGSISTHDAVKLTNKIFDGVIKDTAINWAIKGILKEE